MSARLVPNTRSGGALPGSMPGGDPLGFHRRLPGYAPTPLVDLDDLSRKLGLGAIRVKDESSRLGLPAFKILGASWAVYSVLAARAGIGLDDWTDLAELRALLASLSPFELVSATDGNHGRAVARMAALLERAATVFVPRHTVAARIEGIESEGAEVVVVDGTYDEAVIRAAQYAGEAGEAALLLQDTGWPAYEEIPRLVVEGYATLFHEIAGEFARRSEPGPDLLIVPVGVGSLAAAAVAWARRAGPERRPRLLAVEPVGAACAAAAIEAGGPVVLPGPHRTIMAGLSSGTVSSQAWPWLSAGLDGVVTVEDERAAEAMRLLAAGGVVSGESGAAGLAALLEIARNPDEGFAAERARLGAGARVLLLSTEGDTDPPSYRRIVGEPAGDE